MSNRQERTADYVAAVYGSLLAGSVVVGASQGGNPAGALTLTVVLLATGVVFWLTHVYSRFVGDRVRGERHGWAEFRAVTTAESPLAKAALPPAVMGAIGWLAGWSDSLTAWLCLLVAVAGQVGWAATAALKVGTSRRGAALSGAVNLVLGMIIIALKAALLH